jgi:hypothetical protein
MSGSSMRTSAFSFFLLVLQFQLDVQEEYFRIRELLRHLLESRVRERLLERHALHEERRPDVAT